MVSQDKDKLTLSLITSIYKELLSSKDDLFYEEEIEYQKMRTIDRNEDYVVTGGGWDTEFIKEKFLNTFKLDQVIPNTTSYSTLLEHLNRSYDLKQDQYVRIIESYVSHILEHGKTEQITKRLIEDLHGIHSSWRNVVKLRGLVVKGQVTVGKYLFRDITKKDLTVKVRSYFRSQNMLNFPHSILEFNNDYIAGHENQQEIIKLLEVLILYTPSAITYQGYKMNPTSLDHTIWGGELGTTVQLPDKPVFMLSKRDTKNMESFIEHLMPKIGIVSHQKTNTPINIAYQRYKDSLTRIIGLDEKLTYSIMGLEALLLSGNHELSYQLRIKSAKLLGYLNETPEDVAKNIKKAYSIRSKYLHGSILREKKIDEANELLDSCRNYLRKVILYWLYHEIHTEKQKKRFLENIEKSLINDAESKLLQEKSDAVRTEFKGAI